MSRVGGVPRRGLLAVAITAFGLVSAPTAYASGGAAEVGEFSSPFVEPGGDCPHGVPLTETEGKITCKPTAVNIVALPNGRLLYWDGLEGEEDVNLSIVFELGDKAVNDQSRLLDLSGPTWSQPTPADG